MGPGAAVAGDLRFVNAIAPGTRPWSKADRAAIGTSLGLGSALWGFGWWSSSGSADVGGTVFGVVLGIAAVGAAATGSLTWVASGRRAVRARHQDLEPLLAGRLPLSPASTEPGALVAVTGSSRVHRVDCLLVRGKRVTTIPPASARPRGRVPCEMCQP